MQDGIKLKMKHIKSLYLYQIHGIKNIKMERLIGMNTAVNVQMDMKYIDVVVV